MKKVILYFSYVFMAAMLFSSCSSGPNACDCVQQFEYWSQDGGLYKLDQDLVTRCTEYYKDSDAYSYPNDLNSAERNARKKCN